MVYPAFVQQLLLFACRDGTYNHVETFLSLGVENRNAHGFACFAIEQVVIVFSLQNAVAVYLLDDAARRNLCVAHGKWSAFDYFLHAKTVALIFRIEEKAQFCRLQSRSCAPIACASVRGVQFAQHFAEHFAEIEVVVDVGKKLFVHLTIVGPVYSVQCRYVELILNLLPYMVKHVLSFGVGLEVETRLELNVLACVATQVDLLDGVVGAEVQVAEVFVGDELAAAYILHHEGRFVFANLAFPKVVAALKSRLVVQCVAAIAQYIVAQVRRVVGKANNAVAAVLQIELQSLHIVFLIFLSRAKFQLVFFFLFLVFILFLNFVLG